MGHNLGMSSGRQPGVTHQSARGPSVRPEPKKGPSIGHGTRLVKISTKHVNVNCQKPGLLSIHLNLSTCSRFYSRFATTTTTKKRK